MTNATVAQELVRVVSNGTPKTVVAQELVRVVSNGKSALNAKIAQEFVRVVSSTTIYIPPSFSVPVVNICM